MSRRPVLALVVLVLLAASAAGQQDGADSDVQALQEAGRRFLTDYRPFLEDPGADPARAARLAADLPAVIAIQQRSPDPAWLSALGSVAWRLAEGDDAAVEAVLDQAGALRALLRQPPGPGLGPSLDELLVDRLLAWGRWSRAETLLDRALPTWSEHGLDTGLLLKRADLRRKQERWADAATDLAGAEAGLTDETPWLACEAAGMGAQLELAQGRLDLAAAALARARQALAATETLTGPDAAPTVALAAATELRAVELDLTAGRLELVAARAPPHPQAPPALARTLDLAALQARAELALRTGAPLDEPRRDLAALLETGELPATQQLSGLQQLVELDLAAGDPQRAAASLEATRAELSRWDGPRAPLLEQAIAVVQASRLARQGAAGAPDLEAHLAALLATWDQLLDSWRAAPRVPGGLGFLHLGGRRDVLVELISVAELARGPAGLELALDALVRAQALGDLARERRLPAPDLAMIRGRLVGPDGVILLVVPGIRAGHLLVLTADDLRRLDLPPGPALRPLVPRRDGRGGDPEGLAAALFPPALREDLAAAGHVAVWGASWIGEVDLAALPLDGGRPAGQALALAELPSLPVGVDLAVGWPSPRPAGPDGLCLLVAPDPGDAARERWPDLVPLPGDEDLAARLGAPFGVDAPARPLDLVGLQVTRSADARLLHLVCHGVFDAGRPIPAGLAFQPRGPEATIHFADDLSLTSTPYPPVVLLSACGAARGPRRLGDDGARHLGGAFLRGGASLVLLADGALPFRTTMEQMEALHGALADGLSPARALRRARQETGHSLGLTWFGVAHRPLFSAPAPDDGGSPRGEPASPWWWALLVLPLLALLLSRTRRDR